MKKYKLFSHIFAIVLAILGALAAVAGITIGLTCTEADPVLLNQPEAAREQVAAMMDLFCAGDYEAAGELMMGTPSFGTDRSAADEAGVVLWNAFVDSLSYELEGECYANDSGVAQDVVITFLVFDSVTVGLRERTQVLLQKYLDEADDVSEIYDTENNFREDVVMAALLEAMGDAIVEDAEYTTVRIAVELQYIDGQWWVIPNGELLTAISGGMLK